MLRVGSKLKSSIRRPARTISIAGANYDHPTWRTLTWMRRPLSIPEGAGMAAVGIGTRGLGATHSSQLTESSIAHLAGGSVLPSSSLGGHSSSMMASAIASTTTAASTMTAASATTAAFNTPAAFTVAVVPTLVAASTVVAAAFTVVAAAFTVVAAVAFTVAAASTVAVVVASMVGAGGGETAKGSGRWV